MPGGGSGIARNQVAGTWLVHHDTRESERRKSSLNSFAPLFDPVAAAAKTGRCPPEDTPHTGVSCIANSSAVQDRAETERSHSAGAGSHRARARPSPDLADRESSLRLSRPTCVSTAKPGDRIPRSVQRWRSCVRHRSVTRSSSAVGTWPSNRSTRATPFRSGSWSCSGRSRWTVRSLTADGSAAASAAGVG